MTTRLVIAGGFLGAGKTTLLLKAASLLGEQGYRVGIISNDQGEGLVDSQLARSNTIPVSEVSGGCFCCKFPDLLKAFQTLKEHVQPDIILAEPVGSCTDLIATVLNPLSRYYAADLSLAPLSILIDGTRNLTAFPEQVHYLFEKQLAEAQAIVLNKIDLMKVQQGEQELSRLKNSYPQTNIFSVSAQTGEGVAEWLSFLLGQDTYKEREGLQLDYTRYGEAEAALGWLNAQGIIKADKRFSARAWLETLLKTMAEYLSTHKAEIAHLKVHVKTTDDELKASLTSSGDLTWDRQNEAWGEHLDFTVNARVNALPSLLEQAVVYGLERAKPESSSRFYFTHFECFQPAPPKPTHRLTNAAI